VERNSHLAFEVLHDVQEVVVDVGLILKLTFDCIEIAEGVCHVQRPTDLRRALDHCHGVVWRWFGSERFWGTRNGEGRKCEYVWHRGVFEPLDGVEQGFGGWFDQAFRFRFENAWCGMTSYFRKSRSGPWRVLDVCGMIC